MQPFSPESQGDSRVGMRGILRGGEMLGASNASAQNGDFHGAQFPVMESLTAATKREEENKRINELEAEVERLLRDKKNEERRFREELDLLRAEVEKQALREGETRGYNKAQSEFNQQLEQRGQEVAQWIETMSNELQNFLDMSDRTLNTLMLAALRRMAGHWADEHIGAIEQSVRACLAYLGSEHKVTLMLHPEDKDYAEEHLRSWIPVSQGNVLFELVADPRVPLRGCHMETSAGAVESNPQLILERMEREIREALGIPPEPEH